MAAGKLTVQHLGLPGVRLILGPVFADERGSFMQSWQRDDYAAAGIATTFIQDNLVYNRHRATLRGLHWQAAPYAQTKLIRCISGAITDVVADVRRESPTFGRFIKVPLQADAAQALFVPAGYAHGYITESDNTTVLYKVDAPWKVQAERACAWNDPLLGIDWGVTSPILSPKDAAAPRL